MNDKIKFLLADLMPQATLNATPAAVETLPVTNLLVHGSHLVMRSTSLASQEIAVTWTTPQTFDLIALGQHNLTAAAVVTIKFYDAFGGTLLETYTPLIKPTITAYFPEISAAYMTVTIVDSSNPKGYIQIGRLVAGIAFTPQFNMQYGITLEYIDTGTTDRSRSGTRVIFAGVPYRKITMNFSHLSNANRHTLQDFLSQMGYTKSIFISCYPNWNDTDLEKDYEGFFHLSEQPRHSHDYRHQWSVNVTIEDSELVA